MNEYISTSVNALVARIGHTRNAPVRLAFEPFGRPDVGRHDPDHPGYQLIDGEAYAAVNTPGTDRKSVFIEAADGTKFVLAPGLQFQLAPEQQLEEFPETNSLADHGMVLGMKDGGGGYLPVGVHVVILTEP